MIYTLLKISNLLDESYPADKWEKIKLSPSVKMSNRRGEFVS